MKESRRQVDELHTSIARLDMIVCAMWELMNENGISTEDLHKKIDDIIVRRKANVYHYNMMDCPRCGKPIQESNKVPMLGRCVYCGESVTFYPYMSYNKAEEPIPEEVEEKPAEEETPVQETKPYNPLDDLGF